MMETAAANETATRPADSQEDAAWSVHARASLNATDARLAQRFDERDHFRLTQPG